MKKILSFGEIITDINGSTKTVGGAPLNFAAHMAKLNNVAYIYTALGDDKNGQDAYRLISSLSISDKYIQPSQKPTGTCIISKDSSLGYVISKDASYDHIGYVEPTDSFDLLYFGTLALRSHTSRASFEKLVSQGIFKDVFFDVNIRQNYYSEEIINTALSIATVYKASRDDLVPLGYGGNIERYCLDICNKYPNLKLVIITLDRDGAMVYDPSAKAYLYKEAYPCKVAATVGAGDSFSACFMHNYLSGKDLYTCLDRGCYMGSFVASRPEAIPNYTKELLNYVL